MALSSQGTKKKVCYYYDGKNCILSALMSTFYGRSNKVQRRFGTNVAQSSSSVEMFASW